MSALKDVRRRALAFLEANGLAHWQQDSTDLVRFSSALVQMNVVPLGAQHVITLRAPVLRELNGLNTSLDLLRELNRMNAASHFGKWVYYEDQALLALEYDLLGDHLQEDELMTALAAIGRLADAEDDRLQALLGLGVRAFE